MKKNYDKPVMQLEEFVPNNYCADCGDDAHAFVTYLFDCGTGLGDENDYYYIHDGSGNYQTFGSYYYGPRSLAHPNAARYHPCFEHHEVTVPKGIDVIADSDDMYSGYYLDKYGTRTVESIPVVLWTDGGTDMHATVILDPHEWHTVKS